MKLFDYLSFRVKLLTIASLVIWAAIQSTCFSEEIRSLLPLQVFHPFNTWMTKKILRVLFTHYLF
ncbi:hypothetical protein C427_0424 [Paraglaciecola psychrophila 170]|uniref:Uncharacterized protein n=1 Tax=Paraglaciecola psychrophila 170 TaxID=1129794 RepID=K6Z4Y9_9ALTE|nr:hypothetical protein C427_0424 [Paraglaciecola psychrophila 170]GAC40144.1 hypothetical protein GPSY_4541 [Paraglaciecola psychrophila 170]